MFLKRALTCSFCGKGAHEVAKLVAGPRVFICDGCVATASRIMSETPPSAPTNLEGGLRRRWSRLSARLRRGGKHYRWSVA